MNRSASSPRWPRRRWRSCRRGRGTAGRRRPRLTATRGGPAVPALPAGHRRGGHPAGDHAHGRSRAAADAVAAELDRLPDRRTAAAERGSTSLGTDVSGRDVWARVLYGARTSTHRRLRGGRPVPRDRHAARARGRLLRPVRGPGAHALHRHDHGDPAAAVDHRVRRRPRPEHHLGHRRHRAARLAGHRSTRARAAPGPARIGVHHGGPRDRRPRSHDPVPAHAARTSSDRSRWWRRSASRPPSSWSPA